MNQSCIDIILCTVVDLDEAVRKCHIQTLQKVAVDSCI